MTAKRRLRVLHVMFSLEPGGMENGVVNVANRLPEDEFDVHFCCIETGGAFVDRLNHPDNVTVLGKDRPGFSKKAVWGLMKAIFRLRPHVVHSHNLGPLTYSVCGTLWGKWAPLLQGEHGVFQGEQSSDWRVKRRGKMYGACHTIQAVGDGLKDYLIGLGYDASKIVSIVNGVGTERFSPTDRATVRKELGLASDGFWMGIVGRFDPNKKHLLLVEAFEKVAVSHPSVRLLILGDKGGEKERIHAAVDASSARDRIHLAGFQQNPLPYYQSLDLLTAPSPFEGLSNAVLEAMSCGVPVLGHHACGNADVITAEKDGFLSALDTPDQLAAEMQRLASDPELCRRTGAAARRTILERYSIDRMVNDYAALYRRVAGWV